MAVGWSSSHAHGFGRYAGEPGRRPQGRTRFPGEVTGYVPPGWPEGVRPPHTDGWEDTAAAFLLDCCPAEYRGYAVLRRHPVILARFAVAHVESQVQACRDGIGGVRASLGQNLGQRAQAGINKAQHVISALGNCLAQGRLGNAFLGRLPQ